MNIKSDKQNLNYKLTPNQIQKYSRHIIMPQIGSIGQRKLLNSKVLIIGAGGLGSPISIYLTLAGVGTIGIIDMDVVDISNLQRQILHQEKNIGEKKIDSAKETLISYNKDLNLITYDEPLNSNNAMSIFSQFDIIRCLFPEPPNPGEVPSCAEAGVLGMLPGIVGSIQATETTKLILNIGETLQGKLLLVDALNMDFRTIKLKRNKNCVLCGINPTINKLIDYEAFCGIN